MKATKLKANKCLSDEDPILDIDQLLTNVRKDFDETLFPITPTQNTYAKYRNWLLGIANQNSLPHYSIIDMAFSLNDYKYFLHNHSSLSRPPYNSVPIQKLKDPCFCYSKYANSWNCQCKYKDQISSFHDESMIICESCNAEFHYLCLGMTQEEFGHFNKKWICDTCKEMRGTEKADLMKVLGKRKYGQIYQCKTRCKTGKTCNKYFVLRRAWQRHFIQIHNKKVENMVLYPENLLSKLQ